LEKDKLLLHSCCAPCLGHVYKVLSPQYNVFPYFYNPNIAPKSEYYKRLEEIERFCDSKAIRLYKGEYNSRDWTLAVKEYRHLGERSQRCWTCYEYRLKKTFEFALSNNIQTVATTLSISPHKNAERINQAGKELSSKYRVSFLEADFKKNDGFRKSLEISKEYGFYRQNYCGCVYSMIERKSRAFKNKQ
jgi:predicted adenine nucleotide alpha hydrolase (AANH) superfamily ATPase